MLAIGSLGAVIALQLLAGHAQTSFYSLVILGAFALARLRQHASRITRRTFLALGHLLLAGLWGAALAAIQLLPTAELAAHSQRAGSLTDLRFAYELSFWPWRLISLLAPDFFGNPAHGEYWAWGTYWEEAAYVGILPLLLALLAVAAWWRRRRVAAATDGGDGYQVPFWGGLALASLILALGDHTPLYPLLFRTVPGFGLFQAPARLMIGYALAVALLAGIGAETLRPGPHVRAALRFVVVAGLATALAASFVRLGLPAVRPSFGESMIRLGVSLALAAGLILLRGRRLRAERWRILVVVLILVDLLAFGWGLAPGTEPEVYHTPVASAEFLKSQPPGRLFVAYPFARQVYDEYVSLNSFGPSEPAYLQGLRESLYPNQAAPHYLPSVGNYDPLTVGTFRDLWDRLEGNYDRPPALAEILPLLNLFGARYVVSDSLASGLDLRLLYDAGPQIYHNEGALPAAYFVPRARVIEETQARLELLLDPGFDPRAEVLLSAPPESPPPVDVAAVPGSAVVHVQCQGAGRIWIDVRSPYPGYLVLGDTYYPGWRASVDGAPVEILQANHAFRAVGLDGGAHRVLFEYAPRSFLVGAWLTLAAGLLLAAGLVVGRWQRRTR